MARPEKKVNRKPYSGRVAARLRAMRKERRWSDEKLWLALRGAGADISMSTLRSWQNGNRLIHPDEYPAIAKAFGVELFEFLPPK
ncbi:MAG: helix-turn-helix transcriptional regulator [Patescibacteria group bacterium]|nr:helix-turn-helix transcriptional regulator [Patescibacteria group bacterium]